MLNTTMDPDDINELVGSNLQRLREERGYTQERLGRTLDPPIAATQISDYENGRRGIGKQLMSRLCEELKVRPSDFFWEPTITKEQGESMDRLGVEERKIIGIMLRLRRVDPEKVKYMLSYGRHLLAESEQDARKQGDKARKPPSKKGGE